MKSYGLGDSIKKFTNWLGFMTCQKCKERQQILNRWFPYKNDYIVMTEEQIEIIEHLINEEPSKINCKILNDIRKSIDGVWYEGCFCTKIERKIFLNDFINWYYEVKNNK